jgi:hypothetical protein
MVRTEVNENEDYEHTALAMLFANDLELSPAIALDPTLDASESGV